MKVSFNPMVSSNQYAGKNRSTSPSDSQNVNFKAGKQLTQQLTKEFECLLGNKGFTDDMAKTILKLIAAVAATIAVKVAGDSEKNEQAPVVPEKKETKKTVRQWSPEEKIEEIKKYGASNDFNLGARQYLIKNQIPFEYSTLLKNRKLDEIIDLYKIGVSAEEACIYSESWPRKEAFRVQAQDSNGFTYFKREDYDWLKYIEKFHKEGLSAAKAVSFIKDPFYTAWGDKYLYNPDDIYKMLKAGVSGVDIKKLIDEYPGNFWYSTDYFTAKDMIRFVKFNPTGEELKKCSNSRLFLNFALHEIDDDEKIRACLSVERIFLHPMRKAYIYKNNELVDLCKAIEKPEDINLIKPYLEEKDGFGMPSYEMGDVIMLLETFKNSGLTDPAKLSVASKDQKTKTHVGEWSVKDTRANRALYAKLIEDIEPFRNMADFLFDNQVPPEYVNELAKNVSKDFFVKGPDGGLLPYRTRYVEGEEIVNAYKAGIEVKQMIPFLKKKIKCSVDYIYNRDRLDYQGRRYSLDRTDTTEVSRFNLKEIRILIENGITFNDIESESERLDSCTIHDNDHDRRIICKYPISVYQLISNYKTKSSQKK